MKGNIWLLIVALMLTGCAGSFQAQDTAPVNSGITIGQYQVVESDVGVLYEWFAGNNAFNGYELARVQNSYNGIIRTLAKLKEKTIAGRTDYHRLLYATEDLTEYWTTLWPLLDLNVEAIKPAHSLEDKLAISMWNRCKTDMEVLLTSSNIRLKAVRDQMDAETYEAFKEDAQGILSTLSPLLKSGLALF